MLNKNIFSSAIAVVLLSAAFNVSADSNTDTNQMTDRSIEVSELNIKNRPVIEPITTRKAKQEPAQHELNNEAQDWVPADWYSVY